MVTFSATWLVLFFFLFLVTWICFLNQIIRNQKEINKLFESYRRLRISLEERYDYLFILVENLDGQLHDLENSIKPIEPVLHTSDNTLNNNFDITQAGYQGDPYS